MSTMQFSYLMNLFVFCGTANLILVRGVSSRISDKQKSAVTKLIAAQVSCSTQSHIVFLVSY
jgi:hypothetical protein